MENNNNQSLSYFDRALGQLQGLPDVIKSKERTIQVIPPFGVGTQAYIVQTYRQKEIGDSIFLQAISEGVSIRIVIPPQVAAAIAAQRDQLNGKSRSNAAKRVAQDLKDRGIKPGFMKSKAVRS